MFRIMYDEDTIHGDVTSEAVIPENMEAEGVIIAKDHCVLAGVEYVKENLERMGFEVDCLKDGARVDAGTEIMWIRGNARKILSVERTVLNILGRMSGIATETRRVVEKVHELNQHVRVAATRKTLWGYLDKKAVEIGGGDTHRWNLGDMVMIKDNHIALVGLEEAVKRAKKVSFTKKIEVEVANEEDAIKAAELGADIIMLDNLPPEDVSKIAGKLRKYPVIIEISGGITPENIVDYAACDIDIISMGYLTHSTKQANFSMELHPLRK